MKPSGTHSSGPRARALGCVASKPERAEEERRRERKRKRLELSDEPEAGAPGVTRLR